MAKTPTPTPIDEQDPHAHQLRYWRVLGKSDPKHTKPITGRGFDGTALKPMYQNLKMTEVFGPVGVGWGMEKPEFETHVTADGTILVYCTACVWYLEPGSQGPVARAYGVGGDVVAGKRASGKSFHDDEAYKKCYTDALGNAFKFIGVAADIHMGMFDDSKYVQQVNDEFRRQEDTLGKALDDLLEEVRTTEDLKVLTLEVLPKVKVMLQQLGEANRKGEGSMLTSTYNARKANLSAKTDAPEGALDHEPSEAADQS